MSLQILNQKLLVSLGLSEETAEIVIERITELEEEVTGSRKQIAGLTEQRDQLTHWKKDMLEVERWWKKIDEYVRAQQDVALGDHVSAIALRMLKERRELLNLIDKMNECRYDFQHNQR